MVGSSGEGIVELAQPASIPTHMPTHISAKMSFVMDPDNMKKQNRGRA
ncbi:MAG: hypothetical protein ACRELY_14315 [Polyangiaceae bacterium]